MTAVPAAPEKKEMKSLVIPAPVPVTLEERDDPWGAIGQKEEPLFRPLQNSQRTTWDVLTRAKNSVQKVGNILSLKSIYVMSYNDVLKFDNDRGPEVLEAAW